MATDNEELSLPKGATSFFVGSFFTVFAGLALNLFFGWLITLVTPLALWQALLLWTITFGVLLIAVARLPITDELLDTGFFAGLLTLLLCIFSILFAYALSWLTSFSFWESSIFVFFTSLSFAVAAIVLAIDEFRTQLWSPPDIFDDDDDGDDDDVMVEYVDVDRIRSMTQPRSKSKRKRSKR